jgi:hypothetical protein
MIRSINLQLTILACLISLATVNVQAQSGELPQRSQELRPTGIRATLFYETTGTFGPTFLPTLSIFGTR